MPAYASKLDDGQIVALGNFLRASWGNRASPITRKRSRASARAVGHSVG
jgi:hypothetical protein